VNWTSSINGYLDKGASITHTLDDGIHTITASATDSQGAVGQASVSITVGTATHQTTDLWERPVPTGVSTGNYQSVSAGTIACRVRDAAGNLYALSNTHVFAPNDIAGQGEIGDIITQPGLYDFPTHAYAESLRLGTVTAYKPINGSIFATNVIDAAIARMDTGLLGTATPLTLGGYGEPNSVTKAAAVNMAVQKFGRSTQLTKGTITGINATMIVAYADDWYAFFSGQIVVETSGAFIQPGDSGSLLVTDDPAANPVGCSPATPTARRSMSPRIPNETIRKVLERHVQGVVSLPGVVGVAEGEIDGRPCVTVYVAEKTAAVVGQVPSDLEGWPVVVRESGEFRALTG